MQARLRDFSNGVLEAVVKHHVDQKVDLSMPGAAEMSNHLSKRWRVIEATVADKPEGGCEVSLRCTISATVHFQVTFDWAVANPDVDGDLGDDEFIRLDAISLRLFEMGSKVAPGLRFTAPVFRKAMNRQSVLFRVKAAQRAA